MELDTLVLEESERKARILDNGLVHALREFEIAREFPEFGITYLQKFLKQDWTILRDFKPSWVYWLNAKLGRVNEKVDKWKRVIAEEEIQKYGLKLDMQSEQPVPGHTFYRGEHFENTVFDALFNFCLTYNGSLVALLGFDIADNRLIIKHIQGTKKRTTQLKPFKWERALVNYAVEWARMHALHEAVIISVDNNKWARRTFEELALNDVYPNGMTFEKAKKLNPRVGGNYKLLAQFKGCYNWLMPHQGFMLYDVTALRCGFKKMHDENYVKILDVR